MLMTELFYAPYPLLSMCNTYITYLSHISLN